MQVGILDRKNERLPSFLFIMTKKQAVPQGRKKSEKASPSRQNGEFIRKKRRNHRGKQEENRAAVTFLQKILQSGLHSGGKSDTITLPGKSRENF